MNLTNDEYLQLIINIFDILPSFFTSDTGVAVTNREKFLKIKQPNSFKLNIQKAMQLVSRGASEKAISTKNIQEMASSAEELTATSQSVSGLVNQTEESINKMNNILKFINTFSSTSESQAEQLSSSSEGINELTVRLLKFAKELNS